jgi:hypothetical protein
VPGGACQVLVLLYAMVGRGYVLSFACYLSKLISTVAVVLSLVVVWRIRDQPVREIK